MKLPNKWILWIHNKKNNWHITSFKKIYEFETVEDFWSFFNNMDSFIGLFESHLFFMKENIEPIWENEYNLNGGCFSFKKPINEWIKLFTELCELIMSGNFENYETINGISISYKKNNNMVIKIWNNDSKFNNLNNINKEILEKYGIDIIYISHITNHQS